MGNGGLWVTGVIKGIGGIVMGGYKGIVGNGGLTGGLWVMGGYTGIVGNGGLWGIVGNRGVTQGLWVMGFRG